jgi:hypothetical protein
MMKRKGWKHPTSTNRSGWTTLLWKLLEIARYVENDNLADIKLKLTCTYSIVAMNIYMEQMSDGLVGEDEEEFLQPYIDSVESIRSTRAYNAMDE